ncbi:MAG: NADH:flavin oxidoreductase [Culicoidibacterales bacterium]
MRTLFQATKVKNMTLKNRFIRSATWEAMANPNGTPSEQLQQVYEDLAKGGVGLIITSYAYISQMEQPNEGMLGIYADTLIPAYQEMVKRIHQHNAKVAMQLVYGGSLNNHTQAASMTIYGASAIENQTTGIMPIAATKQQIQEVVKLFGEAALRAKQAGFDAVEIHAAHGYFLNLFLAPAYNQRTDEYGGEIHNRARIIYEIVAEIRRAVSEEFPIMIKLNVSDFSGQDGFTFEEAQIVCQRLDQLGIDLIELSGGNLAFPDNPATFNKHKNINHIAEQSYFSREASIIAASINAKVILVGGNKNFAKMEVILNESEIAYFGLSRTLFSEANLIQRWKQTPTARPKCVACNRCWDQKPHICILNKKSNKKEEKRK